MAIGRGVDLDIIEIKPDGEPLTGDGGLSVLVPNRVLINGLPVLVPEDARITVDASNAAVVATIPVFVNKLRIHAEHPVVDDTDPPLYAQLCAETKCNPLVLAHIMRAFAAIGGLQNAVQILTETPQP